MNLAKILCSIATACIRSCASTLMRRQKETSGTGFEKGLRIISWDMPKISEKTSICWRGRRRTFFPAWSGRLRRRDLAAGEEKKNASAMVLQFMSSLDSFLDTRGYWNEYGICLHQAVESADVLGDQREKAIWVHNLGIHAQKMGN